jgi:hypothetical protein
VPETPGAPKPPNGLLRSMLSKPLPRGHLSDADSEFDTAPIPRVTASGAIASPEAGNGVAAPAPPASANGVVKPAPAGPAEPVIGPARTAGKRARRERERAGAERAAQERARQQRERAAAEERAKHERERAAAEERAKHERERAAAEERAKHERERAAAERAARERAKQERAAERERAAQRKRDARQERAAEREQAAQRKREAREEQQQAEQERARQEQDRAAQERAERERARQERERALAEERARLKREQAAAEERAREERERAAAEERARQERERAAAAEERAKHERERAEADHARQEPERGTVQERADAAAPEPGHAAAPEPGHAAEPEPKRVARQDRAAQRLRAAQQKRAAKLELERALLERARQEHERAAQLEQERIRLEEERAAQEREDREWAAQRRARLEDLREAEERARREQERAAEADRPAGGDGGDTAKPAELARAELTAEPKPAAKPERTAKPEPAAPPSQVAKPARAVKPARAAKPDRAAKPGPAPLQPVRVRQVDELVQPMPGERAGMRRYRVPAMVAAAVVFVAAGAVIAALSLHGAKHTTDPSGGVTGTIRNQAAAWVAQQVSPDSIVSCDPVMCLALKAHGVPTYDLFALGPKSSSPFGSQIVVATATVRSYFGSRLSSVYAPAVIASFGSGKARVDVRVIAPDGAAAYLSQLRADQQERKANGTALLTAGRISISPAARHALASGQVDSRLMIVLSFLTTSMSRLDIVAFGDSGPAATAGMPLRSATLVGSTASLRAIEAFLRTPQAPYRPSVARLIQQDGKPALLIEFAAPSPLQLFDAPNS